MKRGSLFTEYSGKRVLVTGHTGFKGFWLCAMLQLFGAQVHGLSLDPDEDHQSFVDPNAVTKFIETVTAADVRDYNAVKNTALEIQPDIIFHLAAQPLVRRSYSDPLLTFSTNTLGTANVLQAVRDVEQIRAAVIVTTDKVYENFAVDYGYKEEDRLGGKDPYSASKACAELVVSAYKSSYFSMPESAAIASVRSGNVFGGGDWSEDRLVPDLVRAAVNQEEVTIRNPESIRPWQHVLDPLYGYLTVGQGLLLGNRDYEGAWNFGPDDQTVLTVGEVVSSFQSLWGDMKVTYQREAAGPAEEEKLVLNSSKAMDQLGWKPSLSLRSGIELTVDWYKNVLSEDADPVDESRKQIDAYLQNDEQLAE